MNRTRLILIAAVLLLLIPAVSMAIGSASQEKDIYLDTGGKLGHLIYTEQYYSADNKLFAVAPPSTLMSLIYPIS